MVNKTFWALALTIALSLSLVGCLGRETVNGKAVERAGRSLQLEQFGLILTPPFDYFVREDGEMVIISQAGGDPYFNENYSITITPLPAGENPVHQLEQLLQDELVQAESYEERGILQEAERTSIEGSQGAEAALISVFNLNNEYIKRKFLLLYRDSQTVLIIFTSYNQVDAKFFSESETLKRSIKLD